MAAEEFPFIVDRGCGLDVHQKTVVATIKGSDIPTETKTFGTFTDDLLKLTDWLVEHGVTHVAMESTGVYWKPVYYILEENFEVLLVNARHIKNVPGQKTDKKDSEWIAKLLISGLLKGSFVPPQQVRELRSLHRLRRKLVGQRTAHKNRLQNVLESANIKISSVMSDVFGKSGTAMLKAIIAGQADPEQLSELAKGSLRSKRESLRRALDGKITSHHRFMLNLISKDIDHTNRTIADIEKRIETYLKDMEQEVELLQTIPGVSKQVASGILAEIGRDMSHFPSHKHLASWAGVCPGNNESAGKKLSSKITHGNKYLKTTLVEAAWAASRAKSDPVLADKHRRLSMRRGHKRATIAIGHKILTAAYHVLRDKTAYQPNIKDKEVLKLRRKKKIERLEKEIAKLKRTSEH